MTIPNSLRNIFYRIHTLILRLFKPRTLGVRALIIKNDSILLVTHTYRPNWYAIGGGIDKGETAIKAIERELFEEVGVKCTKPPQLFGIYHNTISRPDDYVVLYIVKDFTQEQMHSAEILKAEWFPLTSIPKDTSEGTRRRVEEYLGQRKISEKW